MSHGRPLVRHINRRPFICVDCQTWLLTKLSRPSRRNITRNHLIRMQTAESEWSERAAAVRDGKAKSMLEILEDRGLVNQIVGERDKLNELLITKRVGAYCGVDPTANSLHVGHIVPFMALGWMYIHGYGSNFLLGGFTASIGDPTDRLTARKETVAAERKMNTAMMFEQLKRLALRIEEYAERKGYSREWAWRRAVLTNSTWWTKLSVNDYMKRMGRFVRIGPMLGRDTVKNRLEKGDGMSYAEFSYPLIQAWDWWHQYQTGTQIQIGGADQFGNILAGADAVKAIAKEDSEWQVQLKTRLGETGTSMDPMGFTVPLLTTASGEKFGKSAGNAVWLSQERLSSYDLYQFFVRTEDADVEKYLKMLTFVPLPEISEIMLQHKEDESKRTAQHRLALEFVELVHGHEAATKAQQQHQLAFSKNLTLADIKAQIGNFTRQTDSRPPDMHPSLNARAPPQDMNKNETMSVKLPQSLVVEQTMPRILYAAGLVATRSEGQRLINAKGVYIAGRREGEGVAAMADTVSYVPVTDSKWSSTKPLLIGDNMLLLRTGKWKKRFIEIIPDAEFEALGLTCPGWKEEAPDDIKAEEEHRRDANRIRGENEDQSLVRRRLERESRGHGPQFTMRRSPIDTSAFPIRDPPPKPAEPLIRRTWKRS